MKKILFVLTIALGTCFAANAQSNQKSEDVTPQDQNVEVTVAGQSVQAETTATTENETKGHAGKSCCSSKKGKNTASANSKACCADGKKSSAHCADKHPKADAGTIKDQE